MSYNDDKVNKGIVNSSRINDGNNYFSAFNSNNPQHSFDYDAFKRQPVTQERLLICAIIKRASEDYLKGCPDAAKFFFGEDYQYCEMYFDMIDLDCGIFIEKLRRLKERRDLENQLETNLH